MNRTRFDQERLAMVGAAFETGYMLGKFGVGGRPKVRPSIGVMPEKQTIIHKVPSVPIMLDSTSVPPEKVKEFDGQPLYYVLDKQALAEGVPQVFTTPEKALEYRNRAVAKPKPPASQQGSVSRETAIEAAFGGYVSLYELPNFYGSNWDIDPGYGDIPDFRYVFCPFCTNINDKVSSVDTYIWPYYGYTVWTVLFEHIEFQGSQLWIENPGWVPDLAPWGWNDVASSMAYAWLFR